jgi:hypothetical protein
MGKKSAHELLLIASPAPTSSTSNFKSPIFPHSSSFLSTSAGMSGLGNLGSANLHAGLSLLSSTLPPTPSQLASRHLVGNTSNQFQKSNTFMTAFNQYQRHPDVGGEENRKNEDIDEENNQIYDGENSDPASSAKASGTFAVPTSSSQTRSSNVAPSASSSSSTSTSSISTSRPRRQIKAPAFADETIVEHTSRRNRRNAPTASASVLSSSGGASESVHHLMNLHQHSSPEGTTKSAIETMMILSSPQPLLPPSLSAEGRDNSRRTGGRKLLKGTEYQQETENEEQLRLKASLNYCAPETLKAKTLQSSHAVTFKIGDDGTLRPSSSTSPPPLSFQTTSSADPIASATFLLVQPSAHPQAHVSTFGAATRAAPKPDHIQSWSQRLQRLMKSSHQRTTKVW